LFKAIYDIDILAVNELTGYITYILSPDNGVIEVTRCAVEGKIDD
jgi:hypothetical protein